VRRFAFEPDIEIASTMSYDVCIIGNGVAGLYTALNLDPRLSCLVLSKEGLEISNSWLAQGGIAAAISKDDTPVFHYNDTLVAGAGLCDKNAVRVLVDEGPHDIQQLVALNVPFDLDDEGELAITREGGHNRNRVVHCGGDSTGRETVKVLAAVAHCRDNITLTGDTFLVDILTDQFDRTAGVLVYDGVYKIILTPNVVICTGGIGGIFTHSTNPALATGDGLAAAIRAGAKVTKMEFIQFHPTGLYLKNETGRTFLISEAVRGEGGILKNAAGDAFMQNQHPLADLAPRDIVARAIIKEMHKTDREFVELDITSKDAAYLEKRFPTIYNECKKNGIDMSKDRIPVCPVQHYMIGGIRTDLTGRTNIEGLFACGESASTGVHGANRLASNSMLECLVFGRHCAAYINAHPLKIAGLSDIVLPNHRASGRQAYKNAHQVKQRIQRIMNDKGNVVRNEHDLTAGLSEIRKIKDKLEDSKLLFKEDIETYNMAMVAEKILSSAKRRKISIGAHYREDQRR
jgi:L-aspartate oxidase